MPRPKHAHAAGDGPTGWHDCSVQRTTTTVPQIRPLLPLVCVLLAPLTNRRQFDQTGKLAHTHSGPRSTLHVQNPATTAGPTVGRRVRSRYSQAAFESDPAFS